MNAEELCPQCKTPTNNNAFCLSCGTRLTQPQDPFIGRTLLNQYIIQRRIGQGGYGSVYEALQPSINRRAAIKTLHPHLSHQPELVVRFHREGLATSQLTHPAVVKIFNFGETDDGVLWFAMELVTGENLHERIKRLGPLSAKELVLALSPICEALQEAHDKKIIHRDLKPDNIMLTPEKDGGFTPKLLDFGVAGLIDEAQVTQSGMLIGSPQYMSPEQWRGLKYTDHRSDIYSLGVVAFQCLTGKLPFEADTAPSWMQKHCLEPLDLSQLSQITPSAMQAVLQKALSKNPDERFQQASELKAALEDALRGVAPKIAPTPENKEAVSIAAASNPITTATPAWRSTLGGALGATAVAALLWLTFGASPPPAQTTAPLASNTQPSIIVASHEAGAPGPGDAFENPPASTRAESAPSIEAAPKLPIKAPLLTKESKPVQPVVVEPVPTSAPSSAPIVVAAVPKSVPAKVRPKAETRVDTLVLSVAAKRAMKSEEMQKILRETDFSSCGNKKKLSQIQLSLFVSPNGKVTMVSSVFTDTVAACAKAVAKALRFEPYDEEFGSISLSYSGAVF